MDNIKNTKLWMIFFLYTAAVSFFVQFILLPYILPGFHAGNGLLNSSYDSIYFHRLAIDYANKIHLQGWPAWELRPEGQGPVGIASIFYFFILPDPRILIPLQAALHASAALLLFCLVNLFIENKTRSFLCTLPFLVFPSNLLWTAQIHKDGYSILGFFLILYSLVFAFRLRILDEKSYYWVAFRSAIFYILGIVLIWSMRPYMMSIVKPIIGIFVLFLVINISIGIVKKEMSRKRILFIILLGLFIFFALSPVRTNISFLNVEDNALLLDSEKDLAGYEVEEASKPSKIASLSTSEEPKTDIVHDDLLFAGDSLQIQFTEKILPSLSQEQPPLASQEPSAKTSKEATPLLQTPALPPQDTVASLVPAEKPSDVQVAPSGLSFPPKEQPPLASQEPSAETSREATPLLQTPVLPPQDTVASSVSDKAPPKTQPKQIIKNYMIEDYWVRTHWVPSFIENKFFTLARVRKGFRLCYLQAKSNLDVDIGFNSIKNTLFYLPRAAQIVFFAPFPNQWFADASCAANSLMRKISMAEMLVIYFTLIFLPYGIWYWRKRIEIWVILVFCIYMMFIYGLVFCNVGTLYRMRYGYITTLAALGIAGFIVFINYLNSRRKQKK